LPRRPEGGGAENPSARGQKISSPKTPPFFARSLFFLSFLPEFSKIIVWA